MTEAISCSSRPSVQEISNLLPETVVPENPVHPPLLPLKALVLTASQGICLWGHGFAVDISNGQTIVH